MRVLLRKGDEGADVEALARALRRELGADAAMFEALEIAGGRAGDATIDDDLDAAIRRWQAGIGIIADGEIGRASCRERVSYHV